MKYDHSAIEKKWQQRWADAEAYKTPEKPVKKQYILDMFPYPSGVGLHVGHPRGYTATDVLSRMRRAQGYDVLHVMGWDAFGLPAENTAIKEGVHPTEITKRNIERFRSQLKALGLSYDWSRELSTTDPDYYRWTQWIFLQLFHRGLAYEAELPIWWCPNDKTGLANEEVVNGACERCGTLVERKQLRQWVLRITQYAQRLLDGLDGLNWPESIKAMQRNWIGRSDGARIRFTIKGHDHSEVEVFTTRPDTLYGATYLVLAPEHPLVEELIGTVSNDQAVIEYVKQSQAKSDLERQADVQQKSGVELQGVQAIHPLSKQPIPIWVADYVLMGYGTGAIMAVPAHDERDAAFAKQHDLHSVRVIDGESPYEHGHIIASESWNGLHSYNDREKIIDFLVALNVGESHVQYKLRDWVFSRQRYWGEPIPLVHCKKDGVVPVPEEQLPLLLPDVEKYEPTGTGESPLAGIQDWVNTTCPECGGLATRETNTMPQWAGSCWYYLRFTDPANAECFASKEALKSWLGVDTYVGGAEHAVLHLLYARFWHKVLFDEGHIPHETGDEPFLSLRNVGLILGENGEKMSKSRGNVINPDELVGKYGADTLRAYEMFLGPFSDSMPWSTRSMVGVRRWLQRVWQLKEKVAASATDAPTVCARLEQTVVKVTGDIEAFKFNTCISALMELTNDLAQQPTISTEVFHRFLQLLAPFAPHIASELYELTNGQGDLERVSWPVADPALLVRDTVSVAVQVSGKLRGTVEVAPNAEESVVLTAVHRDEKIQRYLADQQIIKTIYVPGKILNLVVGPRKDV